MMKAFVNVDRISGNLEITNSVKDEVVLVSMIILVEVAEEQWW